MIFLYGFLLSLFMLVVMIFFSIVTIHIKYQRKDHDDFLKIEVYAWYKLIHLRFEIPIVKLKEDLSGIMYANELQNTKESLTQEKGKVTPSKAASSYHRFYQLLKQIHNFRVMIKAFLKTIRLERLTWRTLIGTGDAAETGMIIGVGWGVKSMLVGVLGSHLTLCTKPDLSIQPDFNNKKLQTDLESILSLRVGHTSIAVIRILINLRKRRDIQWQTTPFRA